VTKVENKPASRSTKSKPQRKKARSDPENGASVRPPKGVPPSQAPGQHEHNQASVGAGADQVLNATESPPTPPPHKPTAVEAGADQVLDTTKAPPTPPPYEPTAQEQIYLAGQERRKGSMPPAPRFNFEHDYRGMRLTTDHPDPVIAKKLLMEALGTADPAFCAGLEQQLIDLVDGEDEEGVEDLNFLLSYIVAGRPEDELETMHLADAAILQLALKRLAKEAFRIERSIDAALKNQNRRPSPVKPRDPFEQQNDKFLTEALAIKEANHRGIAKLAQVRTRQLTALLDYRIKKAFAKKLAALEDVSCDRPINVNSGGDRGSTADQPVLSSKVVPLRRRVKS
jgi:hypothetical protein